MKLDSRETSSECQLALVLFRFVVVVVDAVVCNYANNSELSFRQEVSITTISLLD